MKAVVIKKQNCEVAVEEREKPSPGPGQVLIRVHACGVCHSDLAVLHGAFPFVQFPLVPGHEVAGVVEGVGEGVAWPESRARVGMPWLYSSCGHCEQCTRGDEGLCQGAPQITGVTRGGARGSGAPGSPPRAAIASRARAATRYCARWPRR